MGSQGQGSSRRPHQTPPIINPPGYTGEDMDIGPGSPVSNTRRLAAESVEVRLRRERDEAQGAYNDTQTQLDELRRQMDVRQSPPRQLPQPPAPASLDDLVAALQRLQAPAPAPAPAEPAQPAPVQEAPFIPPNDP